MGAKPSKLGDDRPSRSINASSDNNKRKSNLRAVLTSNRRKKTTTTTTAAPTKENQSSSTPSLCTTAHKSPIKMDKKEANQVRIRQESNTISSRRASPLSTVPYDPLKSKKTRRRLPSVAGSSSGTTTNKHMSLMSNNTTSSDIGNYFNKSNISSGGWTLLSNDPFSQIEANASAFTEITDQSTISRKSLYAVVESTVSLPPFHFNATAVMMQDILDAFSNHPPTVHHIIMKEAYQRAVEQNDAFDWKQFYNAIHQYVSLDTIDKNKSAGIVYLAKCFISGLGVSPDIERGIQLLKNHPSCETDYALGQCYLDGIAENQEVDKSAAFECFKSASAYEPINDSILSNVAGAQCALARMLFQGDGVAQNTKEAINYLMKSAENKNT
jgi:hypothetical protein